MAEDPIRASVILNEIQYDKPYRPVVHDRVIIIGDLDANELHLRTKRVSRRTEVLNEYKDNDKLPEDEKKISEECKVVSSSIKITNSIFCGKVNLSNIIFEGSIDFENTTFSGDADFLGAIFYRDANFLGDTFNGRANFNAAEFVYVSFERATFRSDAAWGYAIFQERTFNKKGIFGKSKFEGNFVSFGEAKFAFPKSEEDACRIAKSVMARSGDRYWEDYFFYREMKVKRIQNGIRGNSGLGWGYWLFKTETWSFWKILRFFKYDVLEFFLIQWIFRYGIYPLWLIKLWAVIIIVFGIIYYNGNEVKGWIGLIQCMILSFATAIAPGYAAIVIQPIQSRDPIVHLAIIYKILAAIETILGTFLWAGFIATFVRRYMR